MRRKRLDTLKMDQPDIPSLIRINFSKNFLQSFGGCEAPPCPTPIVAPEILFDKNVRKIISYNFSFNLFRSNIFVDVKYSAGLGPEGQAGCLERHFGRG